MFNPEKLTPILFLSPLTALGLLSLIGLSPLKSSEALIKRIVMISQIITLIATLTICFSMLSGQLNLNQPLELINWELFSFSEHHIDFKLNLDQLSIWFVLLAVVLTNIVGVFSQNYLHRDASFYKFFFLNTLFLNGVIIIFTGASFQVVFIGWELIGITSALLISFFNIRREAIDSSLNAFWAYRVSDIGILSASALLTSYLPHHVFNSQLSATKLPVSIALIVPLLILLSAMGKSAQYPFSAWLPKAMEGPTSSSAIFYGGLSIHAGVYLLLRLNTEFEIPALASYAIVIVGFISAVYGVCLSQVQSDVKSALAYASLSQVGIMFMEIGFGFYYIVIFHCLGHAFLRTYQILKSASILHEFLDFQDSHLEQKQGKLSSLIGIIISEKIKLKVFSYSFDLALKDASSPSIFLLSLEKLSRGFNQLEEGWVKVITGGNKLKEEGK